MNQVRHWLMLLLLAALSACSGAPEELEGAPVDSASFDDIAGREKANHFNHWAPAVAGGMDQHIGIGQFYENCANWSLWDMHAHDARLYGHHEYKTKNATSTFGAGSSKPYTGASYEVCDGYGGDNCSVVARLVMLINQKPYWNTPDIWSRVVGWNGKVYANTMSRSHPAGMCTGAFVLTFNADANYSRGEYWFHARHDLSITERDPCISTHPDSVPWNAIDLYVFECKRNNPNDCRSRLGGSQKKNGGTWSGGYCDAGTPWIYYTPPTGYRPLYFNAVVSSGIGHVPAPAAISVQRWY